MGIPDTQRELFQTLSEAFARGKACLLQCWELKTGEPAFLVCVMVDEDDGSTKLVPLARTFEESPYEQFQPPTFDD